MRTRFASRPRPQFPLTRFLSLPAALLLAFPGVAPASTGVRVTAHLESAHVDATHALRIRADAHRDRAWILRADGLYLHELRTGTLVRRFALPRWILVAPRLACGPDLLLEAKGAVIVSSNIVPMLWRIDPDAPDPVEPPLELQSESTRDFGFSGLRWAGHETLHARASIDGSRWRIDLATGRAHPLGGRLASAAVDTCE